MLYAATAPDRCKARHTAIAGQVAPPVRRGGLLSLLLPFPPATVGFHLPAIVHPAGSAKRHSPSKAREGLQPLLPAERRASSAIVEIVPEDRFLTFGVRVPMMQVCSLVARALGPVSEPGPVFPPVRKTTAQEAST